MMKLGHRWLNTVLIAFLYLLLPEISIAEQNDCSDPAGQTNKIECPPITDLKAQEIYFEELQIYSSGGMLQLEPKVSANQIVDPINIEKEGISDGTRAKSKPKQGSQKPTATPKLSNRYEMSMQVLDKVGKKNLSFCLSTLTIEQLTQAFNTPDEIIMAKQKHDAMEKSNFFWKFIVNDNKINECIRFLKVIF